MKDIKKKVINYDELTRKQLLFNQPFHLEIWKGTIKYEFLAKIKKRSDKMVIFGSGAFNRDKLEPPIFQRHSWINEINETVILFNDPTLYLGKINLGWGYGNNESHFLEEISTIIKRLQSLLSIHSKNVLFYGSSGGGFMALMLAGFVEGSRCIVNNPQTSITKYFKTHVERLFSVAHPQLSLEEAKTLHPERTSVTRLYQRKNTVPKITYIQNSQSKHDINNHLLPFITELSTIEDFDDYVTIKLYSDKEKGHDPLDKQQTLEIINEHLN